MMDIHSVSGDAIEIILRQLGATEVQKVRGMLYFVKFELSPNLVVSYAYNVNAKNQYFLQRILPYPLPEGVFSTEQQIIEFIKRDITKFENATNSSNFDTFIELNTVLTQFTYSFESLFLNYNVDKKHMDMLLDGLKTINFTIRDAQHSSEHILIE